MTRQISVVIEQDEHGYYAWCPQLEGCQSEGKSFEQVMANIREAISLYVETLDDEEKASLLSHRLITTALEVEVA